MEPLYGSTYLPKKFKIAFTVPGDNSIDLYINDIGCVVIMEPDGALCLLWPHQLWPYLLWLHLLWLRLLLTASPSWSPTASK